MLRTRNDPGGGSGILPAMAAIGRGRGRSTSRLASLAAIALAAAATPVLLGSAGPGARQSEASPTERTDLAAAVARVRRAGYTPDRLIGWDPTATLNVLLATATGSAKGYNRRAFFFIHGRFVGTDATRPSAQIIPLWQDDITAALMYVLYKRGDPLCCPTGGGRIVRFRWNGQRMLPLGGVPTDDHRAPLHR
jgi:LppP/LprE lipoprotein